MTAAGQRGVGLWLLACAGLIFVMIVLGGVTRLTESGLSIVTWRPVSGVVPPLSGAAWEEAFAAYRAYPEFQKVNQSMTLEEFRTIFWFEYAHRLLGRVIGVAFLAPLVVFALRRRIDRRLAGWLAAIFVGGGLQGLLGWWMVASGLVDRPDVSQYRLTAHLGAAVALYGLILWTAFGLLWPNGQGHGIAPAADPSPYPLPQGEGKTKVVPSVPPPLAGGGQGEGGQGTLPAPRRLAHGVIALLALVTLTILSGGFVAGLDAGLAYNTFPLMGGRLVPADVLMLEPIWRNHFENVATVQFQHRVLAIVTALAALALWLKGRRQPAGVAAAFHLILAVALMQVTLGIVTLLLAVPIPIAAMHQAGAVLLFTATLWARHGLRRGWWS
ncbi:MAG: heme A synthase [Alphaproteobacteria bacterium]|nr:heme A synthase [Alphaproteobacteria bacterium]